jgi:hypothetical protein
MLWVYICSPILVPPCQPSPGKQFPPFPSTQLLHPRHLRPGSPDGLQDLLHPPRDQRGALAHQASDDHAALGEGLRGRGWGMGGVERDEWAQKDKGGWGVSSVMSAPGRTRGDGGCGAR